ncbi:MAG TPA: glycosyltransferase family 2 protein [Mucilaginibacter sp.]|jgi:glycosyltransferase involved in cell wall biosynthesis|nr:glycosyltransferase family 2 protein [Mucilaginibacter sp.]
MSVDVSIIIPTFNRLWSLPKAVSSCFDPSLNIEVIVVDDGSTDGTWQWLSKQGNIVAVYQENMGKDWAVNKAMAMTSGKYIRFLDSDDWLLPGSSANLLRQAEKYGADIVCAGHQAVDENENLVKESPWVICDDFLAQQLGECDSSHYSAYLFKKDFIKDIPHRQEFGALDDRQFVIETAMKRPKISYITSLTLAHRVHQNERLQNVSGLKQSSNHLATLNIYKKCFNNLEADEPLSQRYKNAACNKLWPLAHWIAINFPKDGIGVAEWVFELNPDFQIPEKGILGRLYKNIGFKATEKILRLRRSIVNAFR